MKLLFCNVNWMKYYVGVTNFDEPTNGGFNVQDDFKDTDYVDEYHNFQDYNGYCYGAVKSCDKVDLGEHFDRVNPGQPYIDNVLVIWIATDKNLQTSIVGWYKNARMYRNEQRETDLTGTFHDICYRIKAKATECYLLPEEERKFFIKRANTFGTGLGRGKSNIWFADSQHLRTHLVPQVIRFIENYNGEYVNTAYTDEILDKFLDENETNLDYDNLIYEGDVHYLYEEYLEALKYYNTARKVLEDPDSLYCVGKTLVELACYDKAIPIFNKILELEGESIEVLNKLITIYANKRDQKKTLYYCERALSLLDEDDHNMEYKAFIYRIMFNIYISLGQTNKVIKMADIISNLEINE